ncbi:DUF2191 domain-containing protein [Methylocaldum sp. BRCS4]|nr:DUF2191 domain-containing protein [Methylocaldum sp. BRCS4]
MDIDDRLLSEANEHVSLTRLIEEGLSMRLRTSQRSGKMRPVLPVYAGRGGLRPTIRDTLIQRALLEAADEADSAQ